MSLAGEAWEQAAGVPGRWLVTPRPVDLTVTIGGAVLLFGYSIKESSGTASAELDVYNGSSSKGLLALPILLVASQSTEDWFGPQGLLFDTGLTATVASGSIVGSLFIADLG